MSAHQTQRSGNTNLPRSPSGRIPKWVLDEAAGIPAKPTAWRTTELLPVPTGRGGRSRRDRAWGAIALAIATLVVGAMAVLSHATPHRPVQDERAVAPPAGLDEGAASRPPVVDRTGVGESRFSYRQPDGSPVTFSPCRPIHYAVRPDHAPANGDRMISAAVAEVSRATGLRFVNDGRTSEQVVQDRRPYQPDRYGNRWAPVLIAWVTDEEDPDFGVDVAGTAGPQRVGRPDGASTYVTGEVHLDPQALDAMARTAGEPLARAVILHELAHLVGLAHVKDPTQIMFPRVQKGVVAFGAGDLRGLAALGSGKCAPDL
jgi:hypothetical protein